ncbi:uncharacterized protein LOC143500373 [Brachyhypopomus gauderio]|uniref:uncharacterized protein LOC143500373 n=1 Tax=Brachyhypopomus gauderio TaxID=698409 RepID=UPI0040410410
MDYDSFNSFIEFIRSRHIEEATVQNFISEKIDCFAIDGMPNEDLSKYLPKYGDRLAVRQYCKREVARLQEPRNLPKATENLMTKLKDRILKRRHDDTNRSEKLRNNTNAQKLERSFQIGVLQQEGDILKQVREKKGGGKRQVKAFKNTTMAEILESAKILFFPNGKSKLGKISDFECDICDFTEEILAPHVTLIDIYELRKVKMLRLYLIIKRVEENTGSVAETEGASSVVLEDAPSNYIPQGQKSTESTTGLKDSVCTDLLDVSVQDHEEQPSLAIVTLDMVSHLSPIIIDEPANLENIQIPEASFSETHAQQTYLSVQIDGQTSQISIDEEIQVGYHALPDDGEVLDDTLPIDMDSLIYNQPPQVTKIRLRRGNVFQDLNNVFHCGLVSVSDTLEIEMVLPNGSTEKGEDNGGVLRDALSEYWDAFIMKCTTGNAIKIPMIRHDMTDKWTDVAKVMVLGYNNASYFPIALAKPFLKHCLGLEVTSEELWETFLQSIPNDERRIVEQAMQDFPSVSDSEDWLDFIDAHNVKTLISAENLKKTLLEVSHKEIIQDPAYISECWNEELKKLKLPPGGLDEILCNLYPSNKKVLAALQPDENLNKRDQAIFDFLKKYIRNCSHTHLKQFLRFCTGADVLVTSTIHVRFVAPSSDFVRSPQAHTCGCVLEMPNTYTSYLEMSEEFSRLLDSNVWVMDIL